MARTLWLYNLYRALCTAHLHRPFYVFVFLERGLSMSQIVLLHMIFSLAVILLEVPTGAWADRLGRRPSMGLGALLMAAASVGYFFAPGFMAIAACEFVFAAGLTLTSGADSAYLYDQLREAGRADEYLRREATASAAKYAGLGVAAAGGGLLVYLVNLEVTFLVTAGVSLCAFGLTLLFPETHAPGRTPMGGKPASVAIHIAEAARTIRQSRAIWYVILYSSLIFVLIRVSDTLFQPVLKNQGFNEVSVGLAFAGLSFVAAVAALRVGRVSWTRWEGPILWSLPVLLATTYLFVSLFGPVAAVALMVPHFIVTGVYSPVIKTLINQEISDSRVRATVLSAESALKRLAVLAVTPLLGLIFSLTEEAGPTAGPTEASMRLALFLCFAIALLALGMHHLYLRRRLAASGTTASRGDCPVGSPRSAARSPARLL